MVVFHLIWALESQRQANLNEFKASLDLYRELQINQGYIQRDLVSKEQKPKQNKKAVSVEILVTYIPAVTWEVEAGRLSSKPKTLSHKKVSQVVAARAFIPALPETGAGRSLWDQGQPGQQKEFQDSKGSQWNSVS